MLHSHCNNNKIKHLLERCLRLTYCYKTSSNEELLEKDWSVSINHRSIQSHAIKLYNVETELTPTIAANIYGTMPENYYSLQNCSDRRIPFARTVYHGTESTCYLGPKLWDIV